MLVNVKLIKRKTRNVFLGNWRILLLFEGLSLIIFLKSKEIKSAKIIGCLFSYINGFCKLQKFILVHIIYT